MSIPGRRLKNYEPRWRTLGAGDQVMQWITTGYHIPIRQDRPITLWYPTLMDHTRIGRPDHLLIVRREVASMLQKGAIRIVIDNTKGFYSKLFLVPKPSVDGERKWRPCINLKPLNYHVDKKTFDSESVKSTRQEIQPNDWAASIDMTDVNILVRYNNFSLHLYHFRPTSTCR